MLSFSVVVNTYNRRHTLEDTIVSLKRQRYRNFEVIVVNGPSVDGTEDYLKRQNDIRLLTTEQRNLSISRNLGIEAARGDIVAFIDDDAVADALWLEDLAAAYSTDDIGGAGGLVFDWTGAVLQYKFSACFRDGRTDFSVRPPFDELLRQGCDPFLYIQGTNCSFRRKALHEIGGFNEQIEYFHDETDVCLRIIDKGYHLASVERAIVYHRYATSHVRSEKRIVFDPYSSVKNQHIFALQNGSKIYSEEELSISLQNYLHGVHRGGQWAFDNGFLSADQHAYFGKRVAEGQSKGLEQGRLPRPFRAFSADAALQFKQFKLACEGRQLNLCFISSEYPPGDYGGIGRYTKDLADEAARQGHSVHVITRGADEYRVDFDNGVFVHRVVVRPLDTDAVASLAIRHHLALTSSLYHEVVKVHERHSFDSIIFPLWNIEGLACICDDRLPSVMTLMTSLTTIAQLNRSIREQEASDPVIALEALAVRNVRAVHAISEAILKKSIEDFGAPRQAFVVPLAVQDFRTDYKRTRPENARLRILFVGRLERRKGVDILLEAAKRILPEHAEVEFVLVGKDTPFTELDGKTYRECFQQDTRNAAISDRVIFTGGLNEEELQQQYAEADLFCLPSRYESFGLVLLEAMVYGLPLVAADSGGMTEILRSGDIGVLFESESIEALTQALTSLINNPEGRQRLGRESRRVFEDVFSLPSALKHILDQINLLEASQGFGVKPIEKMADFLMQACHIVPEHAEMAAAWIYNQELTPEGLRHQLRKLRYRDDSVFFHEVYRLVLKRKAEPMKSSFRKIIRRDGGRLGFLTRVASSPEAQEQGFDTAMVSKLKQNDVGDGLLQMLKRRFNRLFGSKKKQLRI